MARARKGISPVIATVIIVAVAIAISIAVAGWLMGLWTGFSKTEAIQILPDSYVNSTDLVLHLQNKGGSSSTIYKIVFDGKTLTINESVNTTGTGITVNDGKIILQPGADGTVIIPISGITINPGSQYSGVIYTAAGNSIPFTVQAK